MAIFRSRRAETFALVGSVQKALTLEGGAGAISQHTQALPRRHGARTRIFAFGEKPPEGRMGGKGKAMTDYGRGVASGRKLTV